MATRLILRPADPKSLRLSFSNVAEAYVLTAVRQNHPIGLPTIRRGLKYLNDQLGSKRPLLEEQFATRGAELFVERLREIINLSRNGQVEMADMIRAYLERVERDAKGVPIKLYPFMRSQPLREQPRSVVIDPRVSFGRPVVAGTGIPTAVSPLQQGPIFPLVAAPSARKMQDMKLTKSNRFLHSPTAAASALWVSAKTSSAVEGIRQPFAAGSVALKTPTAAALIDYWKRRASKSGR